MTIHKGIVVNIYIYFILCIYFFAPETETDGDTPPSVLSLVKLSAVASMNMCKHRCEDEVPGGQSTVVEDRH